jgi:predicted enzyme related to lactoylglutathione lyase
VLRGLADLSSRMNTGTDGVRVSAYRRDWHVDDVEAAFERLLSLGARAHEKVTERGPGFVTASIVDPFGNVLGVMYNRHHLDVLASRGSR